MSDGGPVLHTPRLILRPPVAADFKGWAAFHRETATKRFLGGKLEPGQAWRDLCMMVGAWHVRGFAMFSVLDRETGEWLGRVGPWQPHGWPGTEVGWGLNAKARGRGLAQEAATASIDYAVDRLGWTDIIHLIDPANADSVRLAERLGARPRGPVVMPPPNEGVRVDAWGQTADDWRARIANTA